MLIGASLSQIKMRGFQVMRVVICLAPACAVPPLSVSLTFMNSWSRHFDSWNLFLLAALASIGLGLLLPWDFTGLDARLYYSGEEALQVLDSLSLEQREMYKTVELLDFLFIFVYTTLLVRNLRKVNSFAVSLLGFIPGLFDSAENLGVLYWLHWPAPYNFLNWWGSITLIKWILGIIFGVLVLYSQKDGRRRSKRLALLKVGIRCFTGPCIKMFDSK